MMKFLVTYSQYSQYEYVAYGYSYDKDKLFLTDVSGSIMTIIMLTNVSSIEIRAI